MTDPQKPVPTTNQPAQDVVDVIGKLTTQGEAAAEAAIIEAEPFMGAPVWRQIWEVVFDWIVQAIMKPLALMGGRVVISLEEYVALKTAIAAQAALDAAKKSGDPHAVAEASQKVDQAVASVIRYTGTVHN